MSTEPRVPRHRAASAEDDAATESAIRIVWIYPDLLSTYGDRGNMLDPGPAGRHARPAGGDDRGAGRPETARAWRHLPAWAAARTVPQALAAQRLNADGGLHRALERGASLFAVCAGYQLVGTSFFAKGERHAGLGLLDLASDRGPTRAVGELAGTPDPALGLPAITGFENHGGRTHLGPGLTPLARVTTGIGNDGTTEGVWAGRILGTYMHGPALARNPAIADLLLTWVTGSTLDPLDDHWPARLRAERLAAVRA